MALGEKVRKYIASDFHNGNDAPDYDRVMGFLDLVDDDADEFIITGDWEELLWSNMDRVLKVKPYSHVTTKVREIAQKKPVKVIIGNHDWNLGLFSSYLEPAQVVSPFGEDGIYFSHGHEWDILSVITGTPVDPIWWSVAFPFVFPTQLFLWLATKIWLGAKDEYNWAVGLINKGAVDYAKARGYQTVIFGHTHFPQDVVQNEVRLVNTGDMLDSYSYVVVENSNIELRYFQ